jgi:glycosyltransferase involved in cell wall biosynthesis
MNESAGAGTAPKPAVVVGLDVRPALFTATGVGRVARESLAALRRRGRVEIVPWALAWRRPRPELRLADVEYRRFPARLQNLLAPLGFHVERLVPQIEVFHHTDFVFAPVARVPEVLTVHDVLFLHGRGWHGKRFSRTVSRRLQRRAPGAAAVIVPSTRTADDVVARGVARAGQVVVAPLGCDHISAEAQPDDAERFDAVLRRVGLELREAEPLVLVPGTREPRKNQAALVDAFLSLGPEHPSRMLLVGPAGWGCEAFERRLSKLRAGPLSERRVVAAGEVHEDDLTALLRRADVVAYPSLAEGFGLPVFEAMRCGRAVLTSTGTPMADYAGEAVLAVDPEDRAALAAGLASLLEDPIRRAELGAAAAETCSRFTWDSHAEVLESVYADAVS